MLTLAEFNAYTGNYEATEEAQKQKNEYLASAQTIVSDFLRFDPEETVWTEGKDPGVDCPPAILLTIKRIATLLLMEAGENIGITGKSMPDNSRTFINYTSYMKYLRPIQNFRTVAF